MDYKRHYDLLISRAKTRIVQGYLENHHILPRCLGGDNSKANLVLLTPEEHYVAHQLLIKIYPNNPKLVQAAIMMTPNRPSNKLYGWVRRLFSEHQKISMSNEGNTQFGTRWIYNIELRKNKKIKKTEPLPDGWTEGRVMKFCRFTFTCKQCGSPFARKDLENFCSDKCKRHYRSESALIIDTNLNAMISVYLENHSINKTLKTFGVKGVRAGNRYFSNILKSKNISVRGRKIP